MKTEKVKSAPLPAYDPDEAAEAARREALRENAPYQRGVAFAAAQEKSNRRGELTQRLADLKRVTLNRDVHQAGRDAYDRCYRDVVGKAERFATSYDEEAVIPAYLPAPVPTAESVVTIKPRPFDTGRYRETKGMGPSGNGLPLRGPGSNTDPEWT